MNQQQQQTPWLKEADMFPFNVDVDVTFPYGPSNYEPKDGPFQRQYTCTVDLNGYRYKWSINYAVHDALVSELALAGGSVIRMKRIKPAQGRAYWSCVNSGGQTLEVIPDVFPKEQQNQQAPSPIQPAGAPPVAPANAHAPAGAPAGPSNSQASQLPPAGRPAQNKPTADDMCALMMHCVENAGHIWTASGLEFTSDNVQATASTLFIQMSNKGIVAESKAQPAPAPPPPAVAPPVNVEAMPQGDNADMYQVVSDDDLPF